MDRAKQIPPNKEFASTFDHIFQNGMGNPIIFDSVPTASQMKANTWGKVKDTPGFIYIKCADGQCIRIVATVVI